MVVSTMFLLALLQLFPSTAAFVESGRITQQTSFLSSPSTVILQNSRIKVDLLERIKGPALPVNNEDEKTALNEFTRASLVAPNNAEGDALAGFSYVEFAKKYPFVNNIGIATVKTAAADLLAQTVISGSPLTEIDLQRSFLFCLFGAVYLGAFQYAYQVQVFKQLFDVDKFTNQSWAEKLKDIPGLKALAAQTGLDLTVLTLVYLPCFYIFKAVVFSGSLDPAIWCSTGIDNYQTNFSKDEADLIKVWMPADLICFSVPLYLRLPVRHVVSFVWTAYLSFARGGH